MQSTLIIFTGLPGTGKTTLSRKIAHVLGLPFQAWQRKYNCAIIQVVCRTDTRVLAHRYFERQHTDRHPGHNDNGDPESYEANFRHRIENGEDQPLDVKGSTRIVDTTDFSSVNIEEIIEWIESRLDLD